MEAHEERKASGVEFLVVIEPFHTISQTLTPGHIGIFVDIFYTDLNAKPTFCVANTMC